ncbi:membrane permease [Salmonella enterica subsp. enterica]|nr:membrane permease [Salmonella enterica subsp. enterica]
MCTLAAFNIKLAIQVYYTQYVLNDIHLLSWMGFFSMGCILIGVLLVPAAVKRFGKKQVYLGGLILWAVGDILNFYLGWNVIPVCYFLLYRLLRYRFRQQPELGAGSGYG